MNAQLAKGLWLLPALVTLVLIVGTIVTTWGTPYIGAVWNATGLILGIEDNSPAEEASLREGDVLLTVDGRSPVRWDRRVGHALRSGQEVTLTAQRERQAYTTTLAADMFPLNYWLTLPIFQLVALAFSLLSLVVLLGTTNTVEARLFYLMAQVWVANLAVGLFMTTGVPGAWSVWGILSAFLTPVMIHFHAIFPERRWLARRRWPIIAFYVIGTAIALHWIPTPFSYPTWETTWPMTTLWISLAFAAAIGLMVTAYATTRSSSARQRIRLLVLGTALGFGPFGLLTVLTGEVTVRLTFPLMLAVPIAYAIALWRHNLMGFDRALRRGVVYVLVSAILIGVYFAALTFLNTLLPVEAAGRAILGAVAALIAAVTFRPLREWIQRLVDRLFYGGWYDYRGLVEKVGQTLAHALDQEMLAEVLVQRVPQTMHLPGAALLLEQNGQLEVIAGDIDLIDNPTRVRRIEMLPDRALVPLVVKDQIVGLWVLAGRPIEGWGPEDESILTALGQQAALAAQNVRLIAELRTKMAEVEEMHRRLLTAREEERADLARELHDGAIQNMVGLRYRLEALQERKNEQVEVLHAQVGSLIDELRRLCGDLRPPMLDQLGLAAALQALAREVRERGLPVETHLDDISLPDQTAIGLYRICQEALSNALRHASASRAVVALSRDGDEVVLAISDDGRGFDPAAVRGQAGCFGLLGMAERAEALGGDLTIESTPGEGAQVTVCCEMQ